MADEADMYLYAAKVLGNKNYLKKLKYVPTII